VIFTVKYFYPTEIGQFILENKGNWQNYFFLNHGKLVHVQNLSPKIFLALSRDTIGQRLTSQRRRQGHKPKKRENIIRRLSQLK
jgi:hypothetical protein